VIEIEGPALSGAEAARRAASAPDVFWLCSPGAEGHVAIAREIVGSAPVRIVRGDSVAELAAAWSEEQRRWRAPDRSGVPIAAGWLSYDLGRPKTGARPPPDDEQDWSDLEMRFYDAVWIGDGSSTHRPHIFAIDEDAARRLHDRLTDVGAGGSASAPSEGGESESHEREAALLEPLVPDEPSELYLTRVARILEYLRAGDVYQVNLARRLSARLTAPPAPAGPSPWSATWSLAAALRRRAPAPHAAWLSCGRGDAALVGNSPERFLRLSPDGVLQTCPIKGTRARQADRRADVAARDELRRDPKEIAEHTMIVDLERNDLGRVCRAGSVVVQSFADVMDLPTVYHLVSTVVGRLRPDVGLPEILGATFPGGSITGAPKIRAMEIIDELEPARRGVYTGATGWLGAAGDLDLAVAIRTAVVRGDRLRLSVGGGIVADSRPDAELKETEAKARAFERLCVAPRMS